MKTVKAKTLTTEQLLAKLPLLNASELAKRSDVEYTRIVNVKRGRVKELRCDELERIEKVIRSLIT